MTAATNFIQFNTSIKKTLSPENIITRYIQRFAYGTDASFYRLVPKVVLRVDNEEALVQILKLAAQFSIPVTFRAAGTSLSGQAITDSVLIVLSSNWNNIVIHQQGKQVSLQPGVIGAHANQALAPFSCKIGPDPASINSCKIGGIAANNASGMCCGVKDNSYHTLAAIKMVFADGTQLNTNDEPSCAQFLVKHSQFVDSLMAIVAEVKAQPSLVKKIQHKYRLKNTTGYGINALVDYQNPIDIISHLMIGSEGTLAFISDITYNTVEILPYKMAGFYIFDDMQTACQLVSELANETVDAVEIMDARSLRSVEEQIKALVTLPDILPKDSTALLIEFSADNQDLLAKYEKNLNQHIVKRESHIIAKQTFTRDHEVIANLWKIRKGMFPAVGAVRATGTTVIIEDVAVPVAQLAQAVKQLHTLFNQFGYDEAIIFGHALAGNLHFVFTQAFETQAEIERYHQLMTAVSQMIAVDYQGSLKAEHGTGRNMAPFVEMEWGSALYQVMKKLKQLFDSQGILNPGVIINDDDKAHIKHLKTLAKADDIIDKCIECGFCEYVCPSLTLTLSPRQRIAVWRQISLLQQKRQAKTISTEQQQELKMLEQDYQYFGIDSCAATGLCGQQCPVGIDTGLFIKSLRATQCADGNISKSIATNFSSVSTIAKFGLNSMQLANNLVGDSVMHYTFSAMNKVSGNLIPKWYKAWPAGAKSQPAIINNKSHNSKKFTEKVVYIPACSNRIFAADNKAQDKRAIQEVIVSLLNKANIDVIMPKQSNKICCGMPWQSKGLNDTAQTKKQEFISVVEQASEQGKWPVITDASPCAFTLQAREGENNAIDVIEVTQFIAEQVISKLVISKTDETFMLHTTCSSKKMDEGKFLQQLAHACSNNIIIPKDIYCCGFAGDKGFYQPELNKAALAPLKAQIPSQCNRGLSNSRTCEIGLSEQSGISYQSVLYLLDQLSSSVDYK